MSEETLVKPSLPRDVNDNHVHEKDNQKDDIQNEPESLKRVHLVVPEPKRLTPKIALSVHDIGAVLSSSSDNNNRKDGIKATTGTHPYYPHSHIPWPLPFMPGTSGYPFFQFPGIHGYALPFIPENFPLRHAQLEYMERLHGGFPIHPQMFYPDTKLPEYQSVPLKSESPVSAQNDQPKSDTDTENYVPKDLSMKRSPQVLLDTLAVTNNSEKKTARKDVEPARYQCSGCDKCYSTFSGLSKHKQFHCVRDNKKEFTCKYCEKCYQSLGALKMHIRTHTLPCKCKICGKAFSRPWLLQGHVRTHTGEKPFTCVHCLRAFADRSNLRAHLQTHSDVKKYSCKTCSKTFSRMSLLLKHEESCTHADI